MTETVPAVSSRSTAHLLLMVAGLAVLFIRAAGGGSRVEGEAPGTTKSWKAIAGLALTLWLGVSALVAKTGILLEFSRQPTPFFVFMATTTAATALLAFSPLGTRLASGVAFAWLIGFQVFRVLVELWLHHLWQEGVIPVQMTYAGLNFDIVSGILGGAVGFWCWRGHPPRAVIFGANAIGLLLLANIVVIAIGSTPTPLRFFHNEPANTFVATVPFVWLPAFLVQAAWFGHLLVFRKLAMGDGEAVSPSATLRPA